MQQLIDQVANVAMIITDQHIGALIGHYLQRELPPQHLPSAGKPRNPYGSQTSSSQIHCWQQVANQTQTLGPLRIQTPHMHPLQFRLHSARSA